MDTALRTRVAHVQHPAAVPLATIDYDYPSHMEMVSTRALGVAQVFFAGGDFASSSAPDDFANSFTTWRG